MNNLYKYKQTSCGEPRSRMSSLFVGNTLTLTFSKGSMTSLKTLSCPSITTSWLKQKYKYNILFLLFMKISRWYNNPLTENVSLIICYNCYGTEELKEF